jgi:hypothetical protein
MAARLSAMLCGMLDPAGAPPEAPNRDETGMLDMPIEEVVAMPVRPPKLNPAQQKEARRRRAEGATLTELAKSYNVGVATISRLTV